MPFTENISSNDSVRPVRVAILAENPTFRAGLRVILENSERVEVLAESPSFDDLKDALVRVDVLILALSEAAELLNLLIREESPNPAVLLITENVARSHAFAQMTSRAWGLLSPAASAEELVCALQSLQRGLFVGTQHLVNLLLNRRVAVRVSHAEEVLSTRELEILQLVSKGFANKEIAWKLKISENTVKSHTSSIYSKMGVTNRAEAVTRGIEQGFITV